MSTIYFITHPDVNIDPEVPVTDWSLSDRGTKRMKQMLDLTWVRSIQTIFCSCERKAIDGAEILGEYLDLPVKQCEELGENDRSSTGYLPAKEFEFLADEFFSKPTESVRGWETAQTAQTRIVKEVEKIIEMIAENNPIAIVSHGAVGTLLLCHLNNWPIARKHDQPSNGGGNFFCFESETSRVKHGWLAIDGLD